MQKKCTKKNNFSAEEANRGTEEEVDIQTRLLVQIKDKTKDTLGFYNLKKSLYGTGAFIAVINSGIFFNSFKNAFKK